jgi:hypothetical protein
MDGSKGLRLGPTHLAFSLESAGLLGSDLLLAAVDRFDHCGGAGPRQVEEGTAKSAKGSAELNSSAHATPSTLHNGAG